MKKEMALTRAQKKYLKKNLKRLSLAKIAADLGVSEEEILKFLKSHWRREKYQKFLQHLRGVSPPKAGPLHLGGETCLKSEWFKQNWKVLAFLTFLVFAVYFNSLGNDFVSDDIEGIATNKNLGDLKYAFSLPFIAARSFLNFIAYKVGNRNPIFYRAVNIIFHLGTTWTTYILIGSLYNPLIGLFAGGILAVHPILVESVTWITGGAYCQYSFFSLLSFLVYILSIHRKKIYLFSILAFILALMSYPNAIVLSLVFLLFEISFGELKKNWKRLVPFFALCGIWGLFYLGRLEHRVTTLKTDFYQEKGINNPLIQIPVAITSYLELIFWPENLTLYHSEMSFGQAEYLLRLIIFVIFLGIIAYACRHNRQIFFWLSFFVISLSPTLTPFGISWIVAERYVYLGAVGIFVLAALAIQKIGEVSKNQKVSYALFVIILLALSARTIIRNTDWKNQDTLWLATAKTSPSSPQNHNNLGDLYARHGELEKAVEEFKKAIELKPNYGDAYHNLANTYQQMEKIKEAIENYQKALSFNPNLWQSYQNLAAIYFNQGNFDLARQELEKATNINPKNVDLHINLGIVYLKLNKEEKAKEEFQKVLEIDPQNQKAKQLILTPP